MHEISSKTGKKCTIYHTFYIPFLVHTSHEQVVSTNYGVQDMISSLHTHSLTPPTSHPYICTTATHTHMIADWQSDPHASIDIKSKLIHTLFTSHTHSVMNVIKMMSLHPIHTHEWHQQQKSCDVRSCILLEHNSLAINSIINQSTLQLEASWNSCTVCCFECSISVYTTPCMRVWGWWSVCVCVCVQLPPSS